MHQSPANKIRVSGLSSASLSSRKNPGLRSEERRVGEEGRFRWWPYHYKKSFSFNVISYFQFSTRYLYGGQVRISWIYVNVPRVFFFFFKQKTAYEIKECDWSSDVYSSDLVVHRHQHAEQLELRVQGSAY